MFWNFDVIVPPSYLIFTAFTSNCIGKDYISKRSTEKYAFLFSSLFLSISVSISRFLFGALCRVSTHGLPQTSFMATSKLAEATFYGVSISDGSLVSVLRFTYLSVQGCNFVAPCFSEMWMFDPSLVSVIHVTRHIRWLNVVIIMSWNSPETECL